MLHHTQTRQGALVHPWSILLRWLAIIWFSVIFFSGCQVVFHEGNDGLGIDPYTPFTQTPFRPCDPTSPYILLHPSVETHLSAGTPPSTQNKATMKDNRSRKREDKKDKREYNFFTPARDEEVWYCGTSRGRGSPGADALNLMQVYHEDGYADPAFFFPRSRRRPLQRGQLPESSLLLLLLLLLLILLWSGIGLVCDSLMRRSTSDGE